MGIINQFGNNFWPVIAGVPCCEIRYSGGAAVLRPLGSATPMAMI